MVVYSLEFKWEQIEVGTYRAKVWGGWLVRTSKSSTVRSTRAGHNVAHGVAMVFVPDKHHDWKIKERSKEDDNNETD